jgi:hypothetical protein
MSGKAGKLAMAREQLQPLTVEELAEVTGGYGPPGWGQPGWGQPQPQPCGFQQFNHHHHHHHHHHHRHPNFLGCGFNQGGYVGVPFPL